MKLLLLLPVSSCKHELLNFMNNHFLCQSIDIANRKDNILDLLLTNSDREKHEMSDDNLVEILIPQWGIYSSIKSIKL